MSHSYFTEKLFSFLVNLFSKFGRIYLNNDYFVFFSLMMFFCLYTHCHVINGSVFAFCILIFEINLVYSSYLLMKMSEKKEKNILKTFLYLFQSTATPEILDCYFPTAN